MGPLDPTLASVIPLPCQNMHTMEEESVIPAQLMHPMLLPSRQAAKDSSFLRTEDSLHYRRDFGGNQTIYDETTSNSGWNQSAAMVDYMETSPEPTATTTWQLLPPHRLSQPRKLDNSTKRRRALPKKRRSLHAVHQQPAATQSPATSLDSKECESATAP